jgi:protein-S-isoprenylcysteine O-methyltransferase Ste14
MLIDEMEKSGRWLFRWRSYLPLAAVVLLLSNLPHFVYLFGSHFWDQVWEVICLSFSFLGLFIRIATVGFTPIRTSGRNTKQQVADSLNTSGMYSIVRNPLYLGNFLVGLGFSLFVHVWWVSVIYSLLFIVYYERIIMTEELFLQKKFGSDYLEWSKQTPIFFPRFRQWRYPQLPFNLRKVCRNEHQTFFLIVVVFYFLELISDYFLGEPLMDDPLWNVLAGISFMVFIVFRILHKRSSWLQDRVEEK